MSSERAEALIHPTALVDPGAELGDSVSIGPFSIVHAGVVLGDNSTVGSHCVLGEPPSGDAAPGAGRCVLGSDAVIRSHTVLYHGVTVGSRFQTGHRVTVREGSVLGDDVRVGTLSDLQGELTIGDHVRLHSNVHVGRLSRIEDFAWLFPYTVMTNDPHPPSETCQRGAVVRSFAVVATHSVLMPGVVVGPHALVGAMSLVTRDVDAETVVVGVPAKPVGSVRDVECKHGALDAVYPWPQHFRRGYPDGALDDWSDG